MLLPALEEATFVKFGHDLFFRPTLARFGFVEVFITDSIVCCDSPKLIWIQCRHDVEFLHREAHPYTAARHVLAGQFVGDQENRTDAKVDDTFDEANDWITPFVWDDDDRTADVVGEA